MAKYRIVIDRSRCLGDKQCLDKAPETFELDDEDKSFVTDPDGNWPEYVYAAARNCPADAITLFDEETGEQIWPRRSSKADAPKSG